jgi:hypothetical protein
MADSGFSPEVQQKCAHWHQRSADLIAMLDGMIARKVETVDPLTASAERLTAEARAILAALRAALAEVRDGEDPLGEAVARVNARLPPLAPAAADAISDLSDAEISAIRSLRQAPPASVRLVVTSVCTLLRLRVPPSASAASSITGGSSATGVAPSTSTGTCHTSVASWEESQQMLARADFTKALKGFDPRTLHAHPDLAASVRLRLAELAHASSARRSTATTAADGERARPWRALRNSQGGSQGGPSSVGSVGQTALMLRAAVRGGGQAVGQLFLWCSRVLSEAADLKQAEQLEAVREAECGALAAVLDEAQEKLERLVTAAQPGLQSGLSTRTVRSFVGSCNV